MSKFIKNALLILLSAVTLFALSGCVLTFKGCENGEEPEPEIDTYYFAYTASVQNESENDVTIYLSVNGGAYTAVTPGETVEETNVYKFSVYYSTENLDIVRSATLEFDEIVNDIKGCTSKANALNVQLTEDTEVFIELSLIPGYEVNTSATLRRFSGLDSVGGFIYASVNGGAFEQIADLTPDYAGSSKVVYGDFENVYTIAFYAIPDTFSTLRAVDSNYRIGVEWLELSTDPEDPTVLEIGEETTIDFDVTFRSVLHTLTFDQATTGNVSSGIALSKNGGDFVEYFGNQDTLVINEVLYIDFYFIYDAESVDEKTAIYYVDYDQVEHDFVTSTEETPVHIELDDNMLLTVDTYANIPPAGYDLTFKFTSEMTEQYYGSSFFATAQFPDQDFITLTFTGTGEVKTTTENLFFDDNIITRIAFDSGSYDAGACSPETLKYTIDGTDPQTSPTAQTPPNKSYIANLEIFDDMTLWVYYSFWERD